MNSTACELHVNKALRVKIAVSSARRQPPLLPCLWCSDHMPSSCSWGVPGPTHARPLHRRSPRLRRHRPPLQAPNPASSPRCRHLGELRPFDIRLPPFWDQRKPSPALPGVPAGLSGLPWSPACALRLFVFKVFLFLLVPPTGTTLGISYMLGKYFRNKLNLSLTSFYPMRLPSPPVYLSKKYS